MYFQCASLNFYQLFRCLYLSSFYALFLFLGLSPNAKAQTEFNVLQFSYGSESANMNHDYDYIDKLKSNIDRYTLTFNYAHVLDSNKSLVFTQMRFSHFDQQLNFDKVAQDPDWYITPNSYYELPSFEQLYLVFGGVKVFKNKNSLVGFVNLSLTDDFFGDRLSKDWNAGLISYYQVTRPSGFKYGLGFGFFRFELRNAIFPTVSLRHQTPKWGFQMLIPNNARVWRNVGKQSYLEAKFQSNVYSLVYDNPTDVSAMDIFGGQGFLSYHYIWNHFLKLSVSATTPLHIYDLGLSGGEELHYKLGNGIGFQIGAAIVVETD